MAVSEAIGDVINCRFESLRLARSLETISVSDSDVHQKTTKFRISTGRFELVQR